MFVRNAWYFAGFAGEIDRRLLERPILGESIVLFRALSGAPVALANRCPHRFAPLSLGTLEGDLLRCGYHGIKFDCSGKCVEIPGQDRVADNAGTRVYPLIEKWGCVWIWMSDPALAREDLLIDDFRYLTEPGWTPVWGVSDFKAGYELILDNLMDLTHVAFLHPNSLGNMGDPAIALAEPTTAVRADSVSVDRIIGNCLPAPLFNSVHKFEGRIDRYQFSTFLPPCFVLIKLEAVPVGTRDISRGIEWRVFHIVTPISATETRYHWAVTRPFAIADESIGKALQQGTAAVIAEDQRMIEAQARMLEGTSLNARTLHTRFDATPAATRRIIRTQIDRETAATQQVTQAGATPAAAAQSSPA